MNIIHFHKTLPGESCPSMISDAAPTFNLFRCLLKRLSKDLADDCVRYPEFWDSMARRGNMSPDKSLLNSFSVWNYENRDF